MGQGKAIPLQAGQIQGINGQIQDFKVGFNATTLAPGGVFEAFIPYVDLASGVIRDAARSAIAVPDTGVLSAEGEQAAAQYDKILPAISELMASRGITGVQDACANDFIRERMLKMQDQDLLHMRVTAATCFNQDDYSGKLDIDGHLAKANQVRDAFAGNPLIKADAVKIFLDGVLEGDPFTSPPFLPNAGMLENYHSPHLALDPDSGEVSITADSEDAGSNGIVNYKEADLTRYVTALDGAGFGIHMHSIGDRSTRVALDALEAARASNGESHIPHTLAHLQVVHPDDQKRLGELGLYLTFTYAWTTPQLAYDMLVSPFIQPTRVGQSLSEAIYDPMGYLHDALYPVEHSRQAGAVLVAAWAMGLLRDSSRVLLDAEMHAPVVSEVREAIAQAPFAAQISDLHVWRVGKARYACIVALDAPAGVDPDAVRQLLGVHEELVHVTVEVNRPQPAATH